MSNNLDTNNLFHWLALYLVEALGNVGARVLLSIYKSPGRILSASHDELLAVKGINERAAKNIVEKRFARDPEEEMIRVEKAGGRIIPFNSCEYPSYLREIHDPPIILYAKGQCIPTDKLFIAVVGSRNPTHYGSKVAMDLGKNLARAGVSVVSGMARGIDGAAQWGCLKGEGFTIGVIGTGIDVIYPALNRKLFKAVWENGAVVSEFPMGTSPDPKHFPIRNRLISGISKGVIVVEATRRSGSLITAGQALEQGREVFAVPGSIYSPRSEGTHYLINQGAKLVHRVQDVLEELIDYYPAKGSDEIPDIRDALPSMDEIEGKIYHFLSDYPKHIDEIARQAGLDPGKASGVLLSMELTGLVKQLPGKMFVRA